MNEQLKKELSAIAKENSNLLKKFDENLDKIPGMIIDEIKNMYEGKIVQSNCVEHVFYKIKSVQSITVNDCWSHYPAKKWSFMVSTICDYYDKDKNNHLFGLTLVKSDIEHTFCININCDLLGCKIVDDSVLADKLIDADSDLLKDMAGYTLYYHERVSFINDGIIINDGYVTDFDNSTGLFEVTVYNCCSENEKYRLKGVQLREIEN